MIQGPSDLIKMDLPEVASSAVRFKAVCPTRIVANSLVGSWYKEPHRDLWCSSQYHSIWYESGLFSYIFHFPSLKNFPELFLFSFHCVQDLVKYGGLASSLLSKCYKTAQEDMVLLRDLAVKVGFKIPKCSCLHLRHWTKPSKRLISWTKHLSPPPQPVSTARL